jgi:ubiquinone biosynthesis protein
VKVAKVPLYRVAPRLLQILRILRRHKVLRAVRGVDHLPPPAEVLATFEELGVTFHKFGQVLAMRTDLLPTAYTDELKVLHDRMPAMDFDTVKSMIETSLNAPMEDVFSSFTETPIAAATIAQVHDATLLDGRHVAVKVQRPGLSVQIATDITAMMYMAVLGGNLFPSLRVYDLPTAVAEFERSLVRELDFSREAASLVLFRVALADVPDLWIPGVIAEHSTGTVLTLEFSKGEPIARYAPTHPDQMPHLIDTLVTLMLHTIFEEGIFHADPHPGNVYVLPDGRLSLLDFGNTGDFDEPIRESLILLLEAVVRGDGKAATEAYLEMATPTADIDRAGLLLDIKAALYEVSRSSQATVSIGDAFDSLLRAGTRNGVRNPPEIILLVRAFVILESMSMQFAPQHNYVESFRVETTRLTTQHFSPSRLRDKAIKIGRDLERLIEQAPGDMRLILRRIAEGHGLVEAPGIEALGERVSDNLERLAGATASAALVIGGAMLVFARLSDWLSTGGLVMIFAGVLSMAVIRLGTFGRKRGRR